MKSRITILNIVIVSLVAFLAVAAYYVVLTKLLSGNWIAFQKANDVPDMLVFAVIVASFVVVYLRVQDSFARRLLGSGFALRAGLLIMIITINRFLSIYPASGAEKWYAAISVFGAISYVIIALGFTMLVGGSYKKHP